MPHPPPTVRRDPNKELPLPIPKPDKEKDANKRPRVLADPAAGPAGACGAGRRGKTLLTHLIRENEAGPAGSRYAPACLMRAARRAAEGLQHTKCCTSPAPMATAAIGPWSFGTVRGYCCPLSPWYQKVQLAGAGTAPARCHRG